MKLKKINENLQKALIENGLTEASKVLTEAFGIIKSGNDAVLIVKDEWEREDIIAISVIQRLEKPFMESPRALVVVQDKEDALRMHEKFGNYANTTVLVIFRCNEKTNWDEDKNFISLEMNELIEKPKGLILFLT